MDFQSGGIEQWTSAARAFYAVTVRGSGHKPRTETELALTVAGVLRLVIPPNAGFFVHTPNEGKRSVVGHQIAVGMGLIPGFPDLTFFAYRYRQAAITGVDTVAAFCELKKPGVADPRKLLSKEQVEFRDLCNLRGMAWTVENTEAGVLSFADGFYRAHGHKLRGRLT